MQFLYTAINFLLLAGIVFLFGRKMIVRIFTSRRDRINSELDEAEKPLPVYPVTEETGKEEATGISGEAQAVLDAANAEQDRLLRLFEHEAAGMKLETALQARSETVALLQEKAKQLASAEPYASRLRKHEALLADLILEKIKLTPGDISYLKNRDVLYVTLTSAHPLDEAIVDKIGEKTAKMLHEIGGKPSYWVKVDPTLIAGLRLRIGDTIYDCTVSNELYHLGRRLNKRGIPKNADASKLFDDMLAGTCEMALRVDEFQLGRVVSISDGICWLDGLADIMYGEVVEFECGERGMVLDIEKELIGCAIYGRYEHIESGTRVRRVGVMASVPVGDALLGRVVNALGEPLDGKGRIWSTERRPIECGAPGIPDRKSVSVPMHTGIKAIDALVPIGRGQRELIIGDRQTGKSSIAIDTIINQKGKNVPCIYVAIGQKEATVAEIMNKLEKYGAMEYTTIVCATASSSASLQYIAPFAGTAMAEYFMYSGRDALIVYDDLSKHAVAYREISLLLHRPSGREAYPGDVFYLHARLLERSARLSEEAGGGSLTALPIIETQAGDISAYIPTNVISITDGQIFLESDLFNEGQRPAVNVGLSVSRVGSAAQTKLMKQYSSRLRMNLAQYRELATFAQFGSDLDENTKKVLHAGELMMAALRQGRYQPLPDWKQVLLIYAVSEGFADYCEPEQIESFSEKLFSYFGNKQPELIAMLASGNKLDREQEELLKKALSLFTEAM